MKAFSSNIKICFLLLFLLKVVFLKDPSAKKLYNGDQVLRLLPTTLEHKQWLHNLFRNGSNAYDFWTTPSAGINAPVDIHVNKEFSAAFHDKLEEMKLNFSVSIPDLQRLIDDVDGVALNNRRVSRAAVPTSIAGTFARYSEIVSYMNALCSAYSALASCGSVGTTFEGRDIRYIQLGASTARTKVQIIIEAGTHAREWLGPATAMYLINRLVTTYQSDTTAKRMLDTYDFVFVPSVNPDGYEFSYLSDRMWRKTRSKTASSFCYGVDPNRNYGMSWGLAGSSNEPCSEIYSGPSPFSERETRAMSEFLKARKCQTLAFISLHTYGQLWLVPYGDSRGHYPPDYSEMLRVANIGGRAIMAVNGRQWQIGNTVDILEAASGAVDDWAKSIGIKYSYTLELRPTDITSGGSGFIVSQDQIEPSGREVWAGIMAAIDAMDSSQVTAIVTGNRECNPQISIMSSSEKHVSSTWGFAFPALLLAVV